MDQKFYLTNDIEKASDTIQNYLKNNQLNYLNIKSAQKLLNDKNINVCLKDYFSSLSTDVTKKTEIFGAQKYYLNRWRFFLNDQNKIVLTEAQRLINFFYIRILKGKKSFRFFSFFLVVIVLIGLLGSFLGNIESFISILNHLNGKSFYDKILYLLETFDPQEFTKILIGYSIVLTCSSSGDYFFPKLDDEEKAFKPLKPQIRMVGLIVILLSIIISFISYFLPFNLIKVPLVLILTTFSMLFWFIGSAKYGNFITRPTKIDSDSDQFTGGNSNMKLAGKIPEDFKI